MDIDQTEAKHAELFYYDLCRLKSINGSENSHIYGLIEDFEYIAKGESKLFSKSTILKYINFIKELKIYVEYNKISEIGSIKLLDKNYLALIGKPLNELLEDCKHDLLSYNIRVESCKEIETLTNDYILGRILVILERSN